MQSTLKAFINKWYAEMEKPKEERDDKIDLYSYKATNEEIDDLFNEYDCSVVRYPHDGRLDANLTYYKNSDSNRWMRTSAVNFLKNPNKLYPKDTYWMKKLNSDIVIPNKTESLENQRQNKEDQLRQSMKNENCELISKYENYKTPVYYLFEGMEYKITPSKWNSGHRAHKCKCIRYTQNYIKQLFENEGCTLLSEYKNQKSKLKYLYNNKEYEVIFNDWKYFNKRPHLISP